MLEAQLQLCVQYWYVRGTVTIVGSTLVCQRHHDNVDSTLLCQRHHSKRGLNTGMSEAQL